MPEPTFDSAPNDRPPPVHDAPLRPSRSPWDGGSDRSHVKTFVLAAGLMAAIGLGALAVHEDAAGLWRRAFGPPLTADEMRDRIGKCEHNGDLPCAQETLEALLRKQPDDAIARAHLGLPRYAAHEALTDALACAELYLAQVDRLSGGAPMSLKALQR